MAAGQNRGLHRRKDRRLLAAPRPAHTEQRGTPREGTPTSSAAFASSVRKQLLPKVR